MRGARRGDVQSGFRRRDWNNGVWRRIDALGLRHAFKRQFQHPVNPAYRNNFNTIFDNIGNFGESLTFSSGMITSRMPPRYAASSFSFNPPIGNTSPLRVISPVIAMSERTGMPVNMETSAVAIAIPAEGPSLGVAPSGTWIWIS